MTRAHVHPLAGSSIALLLVIQLFFAAALASAQSASAVRQTAPAAYVLSDGENAIVVLGDSPATTAGFHVSRRAPGDSRFERLTAEPVVPTLDPYAAARLMGDDFAWIARKMDSPDPGVVWRKLRLNENLGEAYGLLSRGLRQALGLEWVDPDVVPGRTYTYRIVMIDVDGQEVARTERDVRIAPLFPPPRPSGVTAVADETTVAIAWDYAPYAGGPDDLTVGFVVLRGRGAGALEPVAPAPVLRIEDNLRAYDETVRSGETYTYAVAALDMIGTRSPVVRSAPVTVEDTIPPLAPSGLSATDRESDVLIIWRMAPELDVTHYNVYRSLSVDESAEYTRLNDSPVPSDSPRLVDSDAPRGVPVYYWVEAVDRNRNRSARAGPATIVAEDSQPPGPISGLEAEVDEESRVVSLSWSAPDDADVTEYYVYRGPDEADLMRIATLRPEPDRDPDEALAYSDAGYREQGLEPGASLVYAVSAVDNSYNEGPPRTAPVLVPDNVAPDPPAGFSARPTRDGAVRLSWQPHLAFDHAGYRVYRLDEQEDFEYHRLIELGGETTSWTDDSAERGARATYRLTAVDTSGNESGPGREVDVIPTDIFAPSPPPEVRVQERRRGIALEWDPPPEPDVVAYRIYRSDYPRATPRKAIATVTEETEYVDRDGEVGLTYGVSSVDSSGNESAKQEVIAE